MAARKALRLVFNTDTGDLVYSGFNKDKQMAAFNENPSKRYLLIHGMAWTRDQVIFDEAEIYKHMIPDEKLQQKIIGLTKRELLKHLRKDEFE